jgi:thioesterase domain-containing protein
MTKRLAMTREEALRLTSEEVGHMSLEEEDAYFLALGFEVADDEEDDETTVVFGLPAQMLAYVRKLIDGRVSKASDRADGDAARGAGSS